MASQYLNIVSVGNEGNHVFLISTIANLVKL